jgi:5'-3' exonuclease, N-terminal resolvase-like domain/T4 RNase H, C terminal
MLSNLMVQIGNHTNAKLEEGMVRHMVLNAIRAFKTKFSNEYGELVIACDNTNYWRKKYFPYYKANRKKAIEKSELDWKLIFDCLSKIKAELKEFFPYRVIDVESAEADDVIATLVFSNSSNEPILILSGDKDFIQLHNKYVKQYDPVRKKFLTHSNPALFLKEHILKGDSGDGIPNILSTDNCFVVGVRQKPLTTKRLNHYLSLNPEQFGDSIIVKNYNRNANLIDLSNIPSEIKNKILERYDQEQGKDRNKMFNYFISNRLKNLMDSINEF